MYGTISIMKVSPENRSKLNAMFEAWWSERRPNVSGAIASSVHVNDANPGEVIVSVIFESKETYDANAADPEQDKWYREMRALLEADPRWIDGEVLSCKHV
jgi:quinol monooxygenase YgiN